MGRYAKFIVAASVALGILGTALADGGVTSEEWLAVIIAVAGALGVRQIPNKPA